MSTAFTVPIASASRIRTAIVAWSVAARTHRITERLILMAWVTMSVWRFGRLSANTPAKSPKIRTGMNWAAATTPSHSGSLVRVRTSHAWATCCIQVPASEMACPMKNRR